MLCADEDGTHTRSEQQPRGGLPATWLRAGRSSQPRNGSRSSRWMAFPRHASSSLRSRAWATRSKGQLAGTLGLLRACGGAGVPTLPSRQATAPPGPGEKSTQGHVRASCKKRKSGAPGLQFSAQLTIASLYGTQRNDFGWNNEPKHVTGLIGLSFALGSTNHHLVGHDHCPICSKQLCWGRAATRNIQ